MEATLQKHPPQWLAGSTRGRGRRLRGTLPHQGLSDPSHSMDVSSGMLPSPCPYSQKEDTSSYLPLKGVQV